MFLVDLKPPKPIIACRAAVSGSTSGPMSMAVAVERAEDKMGGTGLGLPVGLVGALPLVRVGGFRGGRMGERGLEGGVGREEVAEGAAGSAQYVSGELV